MKLTVNGHSIATLDVTLIGADGSSSTHAIAPDALVHALTGELGLSMREVSITFATPERASRRRAPESNPQDLLDTMGDLITASEAARVLKMSQTAVYRLCRNGGLRAVRIGKAWRISKASLRDLIDI